MDTNAMDTNGFLQPQKEQGEKVFWDLETYKGDDIELMAEFSLEFARREEEIAALADENKREKEGEKLREKEEDWMRKAALKNSARILCAVFVREDQATSEIMRPIKAITWMPVTPDGVSKLAQVGIECFASESEAAMLEAGNEFLTAIEPIDFFSGHNIFGFDLRKWRGRCARHNIGKAQVFSPKTETCLYDTMYEYGRYFSMSSDQYTGLAEIATHFSVSFNKLGSGAEIGALYEAGQYETIIAYCAGDVLLTRDVANRMIKEVEA